MSLKMKLPLYIKSTNFKFFSNACFAAMKSQQMQIIKKKKNFGGGGKHLKIEKILFICLNFPDLFFSDTMRISAAQHSFLKYGL